MVHYTADERKVNKCKCLRYKGNDVSFPDKRYEYNLLRWHFEQLYLLFNMSLQWFSQMLLRLSSNVECVRLSRLS